MYMERFRLDGRAALVLGGTGAIGSHISRALAEAGARVVILSRDPGKQQALAAEIRDAGGVCDGIPCDVTDQAALEAACKQAWEMAGAIHVLVHNAYIPEGRGGGIASSTAEEWRVQEETVYRSAITLFRTLGPRMAAGDGGSIISLASSTGTIPQRGLVTYGMAKGELELLTRYAALEFGPRVRANCISPGTVDTTGNMATHPIGSKMLERVAAGRFGRPDECAGAVVFLASDAASYISGLTIPINGGRF